MVMMLYQSIEILRESSGTVDTVKTRAGNDNIIVTATGVVEKLFSGDDRVDQISRETQEE